MKRAFSVAAMTLALAAWTPAWSQPGPGPGGAYAPGYGMGPGMMGGYGPGYGMGPGMMGGYGPGGSGYGMGPGMMRGYGAGAPLGALDLSDEQRERILAIQEENRRKNWDRMGEMRAEQFKLRSLYNSDNIDPQAFAEQQKRVDDLRRELLVSRLEARRQIENVLTPEQRRQFRQFGPRWLEDGAAE